MTPTREEIAEAYKVIQATLKPRQYALLLGDDMEISAIGRYKTGTVQLTIKPVKEGSDDSP